MSFVNGDLDQKENHIQQEVSKYETPKKQSPEAVTENSNLKP